MTGENKKNKIDTTFLVIFAATVFTGIYLWSYISDYSEECKKIANWNKTTIEITEKYSEKYATGKTIHTKHGRRKEYKRNNYLIGVTADGREVFTTRAPFSVYIRYGEGDTVEVYTNPYRETEILIPRTVHVWVLKLVIPTGLFMVSTNFLILYIREHKWKNGKKKMKEA